jgi:hypothetical protein
MQVLREDIIILRWSQYVLDGLILFVLAELTHVNLLNVMLAMDVHLTWTDVVLPFVPLVERVDVLMAAGMKHVTPIGVIAALLLVVQAVILEWVTIGEHSLFMLLNVIVNVKEHLQLQHHLLGLKFSKIFMSVGCVVDAGLLLMDTEGRALWQHIAAVVTAVEQDQLVVLDWLRSVSYKYY